MCLLGTGGQAPRAAAGSPSLPPWPPPARSLRHGKSGRKPLYTIEKTTNVYQRLLPLPPKGAKVGGPASRLPPTFFERGGPAEGRGGARRQAPPGFESKVAYKTTAFGPYRAPRAAVLRETLDSKPRTLTYRGANVHARLAVVGLPTGQRPRAAGVVVRPIGQRHRLRGLRRALQLGFSY